MNYEGFIPPFVVMWVEHTTKAHGVLQFQLHVFSENFICEFFQSPLDLMLSYCRCISRVKERVELHLHSPNKPSWRGAWFKKSTGTTLHLPLPLAL